MARVGPWTPARARSALEAAGFVRDRDRAGYRLERPPASTYVEPESRPILEARGVDPDDPVVPVEPWISSRALFRHPRLVGEIALGVIARRLRARTKAAAA